MIVISPWEHGSAFVNGREVYFQDYKSSVSDAVAKILLLRGPYKFEVSDPKPLLEAKTGLLIRDVGLGDIMLLTPIAREIKKLNPGIKLDFMVPERYAGLLQGNPFINKVITSETLDIDKIDTYQWFAKFNNCEFDVGKHGWMHRVDIFAHMVPEIPRPITDRSLTYVVSPDDKSWARTLFPDSVKPLVGVVLTAHCVSRMLKRETHQAICQALLDKGIKLVIINHIPQNIIQEREGIKDMSGKMSVRQLGAIIDRCDCLLTPDTGTFHIANAIGKSNAAYFGAINPELRITNPACTHLVPNTPVDCFPCDAYTCEQPLCIWNISVPKFVETVVEGINAPDSITRSGGGTSVAA